MRVHDPLTHTKASAGVELMMDKGWVHTVEDLQAPTQRLRFDLPTPGHVSHKKASVVARSEMEEVKARTKTNLQALLSIEQCPDQVAATRRILLGTRSTFDFFNVIHTSLKGPAKSLKFHQNMAQEEWMSILIAGWQCLHDVHELERSSMIIDFSQEMIDNIGNMEEEICIEDAKAKQLGVLVPLRHPLVDPNHGCRVCANT